MRELEARKEISVALNTEWKKINSGHIIQLDFEGLLNPRDQFCRIVKGRACCGGVFVKGLASPLTSKYAHVGGDSSISLKRFSTCLAKRRKDYAQEHFTLNILDGLMTAIQLRDAQGPLKAGLNLDVFGVTTVQPTHDGRRSSRNVLSMPRAPSPIGAGIESLGSQLGDTATKRTKSITPEGPVFASGKSSILILCHFLAQELGFELGYNPWPSQVPTLFLSKLDHVSYDDVVRKPKDAATDLRKTTVRLYPMIQLAEDG
ncbi:hypothetical protein BDQ12DRAFT_712266 [Crucibulum laeve]|uniref:Uncharacterized protein n=1 Tax=Crucibulum laeve TaxID=68775 RepID=A0A5C3M345_9AGAR|nr:hypothetical protein BDQ12DRAFT_712266 [Crucibulum laeve]